jgi:hypothetical protein
MMPLRICGETVWLGLKGTSVEQAAVVRATAATMSHPVTDLLRISPPKSNALWSRRAEKVPELTPPATRRSVSRRAL